jgi:hypothetical protein
MMGTPKNTPIKHAILQVLTQKSGGAKDATAIAEASINTWSEVTILLAPIIGGGGVDALFNRSLTIAARAYPWLSPAKGSDDCDTPVDRLRTNLETRDANSALEASAVIMVIFYQMLETFIGELLAERLLGSIWGHFDKRSQREVSQ